MTAGNGTGDSPAAGDAMAAGTSSAAGATRTVTNVVLAGLGGQGVIKASDILADAALRAGFDVKKAEIHGMSQRGGSVTSDVRFGRKVLSPMVPRGEADYLLVLAASEVEVARPLLRPGGVLLSPDLIPEDLLPNKRSLNVALLGSEPVSRPAGRRPPRRREGGSAGAAAQRERAGFRSGPKTRR
jgi:Pyruvate:ferredoxin oxidoreductase and related 2-oxoacid:ferredoxin oxidoreductases, gamma subunit